MLELVELKKKIEDEWEHHRRRTGRRRGRRSGRRRCRGGGGEDRLRRRPRRGRQQEDPGDQGRPCRHRAWPQGGQGPGRLRPPGRQGGREPGGGRPDQGPARRGRRQRRGRGSAGCTNGAWHSSARHHVRPLPPDQLGQRDDPLPLGQRQCGLELDPRLVRCPRARARSRGRRARARGSRGSRSAPRPPLRRVRAARQLRARLVSPGSRLRLAHPTCGSVSSFIAQASARSTTPRPRPADPAGRARLRRRSPR